MERLVELNIVIVLIFVRALNGEMWFPFYVTCHIIKGNLYKMFAFKMHKLHVLCNILHKVLLQLQFSPIECNYDFTFFVSNLLLLFSMKIFLVFANNLVACTFSRPFRCIHTDDRWGKLECLEMSSPSLGACAIVMCSLWMWHLI